MRATKSWRGGGKVPELGRKTGEEKKQKRPTRKIWENKDSKGGRPKELQAFVHTGERTAYKAQEEKGDRVSHKVFRQHAWCMTGVSKTQGINISSRIEQGGDIL